MSVLAVRRIKDKALAEKLNRYSHDFNWIQDNRLDLQRKYNRKYIAVKNEDVIFFADSIEEMLAKILKSGGNIDEYIVDYITDEKISLLF